MTGLDLTDVALAGLLSCLTPEALLLLPLGLAAIGAGSIVAALGSALGLGMALVLAAPLCVWVGEISGYGPVMLRWIACILLLLQGLILSRRSLTEEFSYLSGGTGNDFRVISEGVLTGFVRHLLLGGVIGAIWLPRLGPALGNATLRAVDAQSNLLPLIALFLFGVAAALPWIVLGRILRTPLRLIARPFVDGMWANRIFGLVLLAVSALVLSGLERPVMDRINLSIPDWAQRLASLY